MNHISKAFCFILLIAITGCSKDEVDENLPVVTTTTVSLITANSARSGGEIIKEGTSPVLTKGVSWSKDPNPTIDDNYTEVSGDSPTFESTLTELEPETQYFVRSYATNASGTVYGNQVEFTTLEVTAPCSPEDNTLNHDGMKITYTRIGAGENYSFFGEYGVMGSGMYGDLRVDFNHVPKSGVYKIVTDFSLNRTLNESIISAVVDQGVMNSWCTSRPSPGAEIYVTKLAENSYKITFCAIEFSCLLGYNDYRFTSDGNLTD